MFAPSAQAAGGNASFSTIASDEDRAQPGGVQERAGVAGALDSHLRKLATSRGPGQQRLRTMAIAT